MTAGDPIEAGERLIPHRPGLDGLRGLSVAAVLLFHGGFTWAVGGYLGVSVFFTLSGYLITSLLLAEHVRDGRVDLRRFWARRFRRLLPASLLALVGIGIFGLTVATAEQAERLAGDIAAALAYVANWRFILGDTSYANLFAEPTPVLHFWSLAIEEQFYLIFPPLMVALLALARGRLVLVGGVLGVLFAASVGASFLHGTSDLDRIYFGTDTRAAELLAGAVLAVVVLAMGSRLRQTAGPIVTIGAVGAIGALVYAVVNVEGQSLWLYRGGFAAISVLSMVAIVGATRDGPLATAMGVEPLRWLGTRSYGIYLFHWPIFLWLDPDTVGLDGVRLFAVRVAVTLAITELSYRLVETPIRYRNPLPPLVRLALPATGAIALLVGVVATANAPEPLVALTQSIDQVPPAPVVSVAEVEAKTVFIGDTLAPRLAQEVGAVLGRRSGIELGDATSSDCVLFGEVDAASCASLADGWSEAAANAELVVISLGVGDPPTPARAPIDPTAVAVQLDALRNRLSSASTVVWVTQPLVLAPDDLPALEIDPAATAWAAQAAVNEAVLEIAASRGDQAIDLARYMRFSELNDGTGESIIDPGEDRILLALGWVADQIAEQVESELPVAVDAVRILVVGDSVAYSLGRGLEEWATDLGDAIVWNVGTTGCGVLRAGTIIDTEIQPSPACTLWPERFGSHLEEFDPDVVLVMSTGWDLLQRRLPEWPDFRTAGAPEFDAYMLEEYQAAVEVLSSAGAAVAWGTSPCVSPQRAVVGSVFDPARTASQNVVVRRLGEVDERVAIVDVAGVVCPGGVFVNTVGDVTNFRPDGVHFSDPGSRWVAERIGPELLELASP